MLSEDEDSASMLLFPLPLIPEVVADINATIGMNRLSSEVTEKLNQEKTTNNYNAPSVGVRLRYLMDQRLLRDIRFISGGSQQRELVWEEKAPVSLARSAFDGVEVLGGKIYFVGGGAVNNSAHNIAERYDPVSTIGKRLHP